VAEQIVNLQLLVIKVKIVSHIGGILPIFLSLWLWLVRKERLTHLFFFFTFLLVGVTLFLLGSSSKVRRNEVGVMLRQVAVIRFRLNFGLKCLSILISTIQVHDKFNYRLCKNLMEVQLSQNEHQVAQKNDSDCFTFLGARFSRSKISFHQNHRNFVFTKFLEHFIKSICVLGPNQILVF
jgi:hypothetical protein